MNMLNGEIYMATFDSNMSDEDRLSILTYYALTGYDKVL